MRITYETSKWAAGIVANAAGVPGGSAMVDAIGGFIDFALNVQSDGLDNAFGTAITDALTYSIINHVPFADLGGKTLAQAIENRSGKLLADEGVIAALRDGIKDTGMRKVVVDGAKSLLALPLQLRAEGQINAALHRLLSVDPTTY